MSLGAILLARTSFVVGTTLILLGLVPLFAATIGFHRRTGDRSVWLRITPPWSRMTGREIYVTIAGYVLFGLGAGILLVGVFLEIAPQ